MPRPCGVLAGHRRAGLPAAAGARAPRFQRPFLTWPHSEAQASRGCAPQGSGPALDPLSPGRDGRARNQGPTGEDGGRSLSLSRSRSSRDFTASSRQSSSTSFSATSAEGESRDVSPSRCPPPWPHTQRQPGDQSSRRSGPASSPNPTGHRVGRELVRLPPRQVVEARTCTQPGIPQAPAASLQAALGPPRPPGWRVPHRHGPGSKIGAQGAHLLPGRGWEVLGPGSTAQTVLTRT